MDKKVEAVEQLVKVFRQYGYEGATLSRISEETGLGKASLYHYFPKGKQEMAEAVLNYVQWWFKITVLEPLMSEGEPSDRLQFMSENLNRFYNRGRDACLLAIFTLGESNELFGEYVQQALRDWIESLTQVAIDAGLSPEQARQRSEDAVMQIQGALIVARGLGSTQPFERTLQDIPGKLLR